MLKKWSLHLIKMLEWLNHLYLYQQRKNSNQKALVIAHQLGLYLTVIELS